MSTPQVVKLTVSQLLSDLANRKTWFKSQDFGYGSIQEAYGADDDEILAFMSHPKLIGKQPRNVIFELKDDTDSEGNLIVDLEEPSIASFPVSQVATVVTEPATVTSNVGISSNANSFLNI